MKDQITKKNLNLISISGGEPLITDSHYQLLDFLIKNNLTDVNSTILVLAWNFYKDIKQNNSSLSDNFVNIKELESNNWK